MPSGRSPGEGRVWGGGGGGGDVQIRVKAPSARKQPQALSKQ